MTLLLELNFVTTRSLLKVNLVSDNHGQWESVDDQKNAAGDELVIDDNEEIITLSSLSLSSPIKIDHCFHY